MLLAGFPARPNLVRAATVLCIALCTGVDAHAQSAEWSDRAFLNVNMAMQLTARPFNETLSPLINAERAVLGIAHPGDGGKPAIEVGAGVRVWNSVGIGGAFTTRTVSETPMVQALIPHPLLFNQPRTAAKAAPFNRGETAIHAQVIWMLPITTRLDVALSAGPSFISLQQDLLESIEVAEAGAPFTTVSIGEVAVLTRDVQTVAMHAGADVTWFLTPIAGVGFTARYVTGTASTTLSDGSSINLDVGGLQLGWGARIRLR